MTFQKILNDAAQKIVHVSKNPEHDRIKGYFDRTKEYCTRLFDGFARSNDHSNDYYNRLIHPESDRTRACVTVEWVAFAEIAQDTDMIYIPCGISSGLRAHELLDQHNSSRQPTDKDWGKSTYKVEQYSGVGAKHLTHVIEPNKADNLRRARIIGREHPDKMIIAPVVREGAVRALNDRAFSGGQRYEEEDFMAFWFPVIDRCKGMVLDGDWNFSRNSIWEMMRGVLIQAGQIPSRPKADMDVLNLEGRPVTLQARAEKVAEFLKYQLGKGFEPREAATALAQIFTLDDEIRACKIPPDGSKLHDVLRLRPAEELAAMDKLKTEFKPILLSHCAHLMRLDDLPAEYHEAAHKAAKANPKMLISKLIEKLGKKFDAFKKFADDISAHALNILSVQPLVTRKQEATLPQRLFDSHERFFEKNSQAKMFEDDLYGKLSEWERQALPFAIGATETGLYPTAKPMATMVLTDLKRGKAGFERAQKAGVQDMSELAGALGRRFEEVKAINAEAAETLKVKLKAEHPGKIVVNTLSFLRIADTIERERPQGFVAAVGTSKTSPQMRLALQMKYLDRNVNCAVFQEGWEHSNDLVQLRVRARLIQAGLVKRPAGDQSPLYVVGAADPATPETLLDDLKLLTKEVKRCADADARAPEQAIALARLVALHELIVDQTLGEIINNSKADDSLTCYKRADAKTVTEEAKAILKGKAALWIPRERLYVESAADDDADRAAAKMVQNRRMEEYINAQERLWGEQALAKQPTPHGEIHIKQSGAQR